MWIIVDIIFAHTHTPLICNIVPYQYIHICMYTYVRTCMHMCTCKSKSNQISHIAILCMYIYIYIRILIYPPGPKGGWRGRISFSSPHHAFRPLRSSETLIQSHAKPVPAEAYHF